MPRGVKKDQTPGEAAASATVAPRGVVLTVPTVEQERIRKFRERTGKKLSAIVRELETSPQVEAAIREALRRQWNRWREEHEKDDLFGPEEASRG